MNRYKVFLNATVSVSVDNISADTADMAARIATGIANTQQLEYWFDLKRTDNIETFFADDIPTVMIDTLPADDGEPIATEWRRVDVPADDIDVLAAVEDVFRVYDAGPDPFANEELKAKFDNLRAAVAKLPRELVLTNPIEVQS